MLVEEAKPLPDPPCAPSSSTRPSSATRSSSVPRFGRSRRAGRGARSAAVSPRGEAVVKGLPAWTRSCPRQATGRRRPRGTASGSPFARVRARRGAGVPPLGAIRIGGLALRGAAPHRRRTSLQRAGRADRGRPFVERSLGAGRPRRAPTRPPAWPSTHPRTWRVTQPRCSGAPAARWSASSRAPSGPRSAGARSASPTLARRARRIRSTILVLGGPSEREMARAIADGSGARASTHRELDRRGPRAAPPLRPRDRGRTVRSTAAAPWGAPRCSSSAPPTRRAMSSARGTAWSAWRSTAPRATITVRTLPARTPPLHDRVPGNRGGAPGARTARAGAEPGAEARESE